MPEIRHFIIRLTAPDTVTDANVADYILEALHGVRRCHDILTGKVGGNSTAIVLEAAPERLVAPNLESCPSMEEEGSTPLPLEYPSVMDCVVAETDWTEEELLATEPGHDSSRILSVPLDIRTKEQILGYFRAKRQAMTDPSGMGVADA